MNYYLIGHNARHAVEEMLFHLLPTDKMTQLEEMPENLENTVCSEVEMDENIVKVKCFTMVKNNEISEEITVNIENLSELEKKRVMNNTVKQTIYNLISPTLATTPKWGSLTGVRPAKLTRSIMEGGNSSEETYDILTNKYNVSANRSKLAIHSAETALKFKNELGKFDVSIYVGIPFCPSRCSYCSFVSNSIEKAGALIEPYLETLFVEIAETAKVVKSSGLNIVSIYIGGGTPTTLTEIQLENLLNQLEQHFDFSSLKEYTVEAGRPDTITVEKLEIMKNHNVTRISINPQSMNDIVLEGIGRKHNANDVIEVYKKAREIGFDCINMDTIAGLEFDTLDSFRNTIDTLIDLNPENITVHTLAIKKGANLEDKEHNQNKHLLVGDMLDYAEDRLYSEGYKPYYLYRQKFMAGGYENVGWCKEGFEGLYNVYMMEELQTIISLGAGAVTKLYFPQENRIERVGNPKYPYEYIHSIEKITSSKQAIAEFADYISE